MGYDVVLIGIVQQFLIRVLLLGYREDGGSKLLRKGGR
jgi:hypothetical protein